MAAAAWPLFAGPAGSPRTAATGRSPCPAGPGEREALRAAPCRARQRRSQLPRSPLIRPGGVEHDHAPETSARNQAAPALGGGDHRGADRHRDLRLPRRGRRSRTARSTRASPCATSRRPTTWWSSASTTHVLRPALQWPFPRSLHAQAIDRLHADGARAIVYDVQFTEPTTPARGQRAVRRGRPGARRRARHDRGRRARRTPTCSAATRTSRGSHAVAAASQHAERRGRRRSACYPDSELGLPSLAVAAAEAAGGRSPPVASSTTERRVIDYRGPAGTIPTFSFSDVVDRQVVPARAFAGKIVVVGASSPTLAGRPRHADQRRRPADVRPRGPGQRDLDRPARQSAAPARRRGWRSLAIVARRRARRRSPALRLRPADGGRRRDRARRRPTSLVAQISFDSGTILTGQLPAGRLASACGHGRGRLG